MSKTTKILLSIIISSLCLVLILFGILAYLFTHRPKGDLLAKSISPDGRWKIEAYTINPGAMASTIHYANVKDLKSKRPAYRINLSGDQLNGDRIQWKNDHIVNILGEIVEVPSGSSQLVGISTSPDEKWQASIYFIYHRGSPDNGYYYAQISESKRDLLVNHDVELSPSKLVKDQIWWKNNNVVDIYGELVDVRAKSGKQPRSSRSRVSKNHLSKASSPNKRWMVTVSREWVGPWPLGDYYYYAKVTDLKGRVPTHNIDLSEANISEKEFHKNRVQWKTKYLANIHGQIVDVRTGSSRLDRTTVSPSGRWKVRLYYLEPGGLLDTRYAQVTALKGKMPARKIYLSSEDLLGDGVRWENGNTINVWGEVINVQTGQHRQAIEN